MKNSLFGTISILLVASTSGAVSAPPKCELMLELDWDSQRRNIDGWNRYQERESFELFRSKLLSILERRSVEEVESGRDLPFQNYVFRCKNRFGFFNMGWECAHSVAFLEGVLKEYRSNLSPSEEIVAPLVGISNKPTSEYDFECSIDTVSLQVDQLDDCEKNRHREQSLNEEHYQIGILA